MKNSKQKFKFNFDTIWKQEKDVILKRPKLISKTDFASETYFHLKNCLPDFIDAPVSRAVIGGAVMAYPVGHRFNLLKQKS